MIPTFFTFCDETHVHERDCRVTGFTNQIEDMMIHFMLRSYLTVSCLPLSSKTTGSLALGQTCKCRTENDIAAHAFAESIAFFCSSRGQALLYNLPDCLLANNVAKLYKAGC